MRKIIIAVLTICFLCSLPITKVQAKDSSMIDSYYEIKDKNGNITFSNVPASILRSGNHSTYSVITSGNKSWYDNGYHPQTKLWRRVSAYYFLDSSKVNIAVNFNVAGEAISGGISVSSVSGTQTAYAVTADQNRDSKLRVYTDFSYVKYLVTTYDDVGGYVVGQYEYTSMTLKAERFIPVYQ